MSPVAQIVGRSEGKVRIEVEAGRLDISEGAVLCLGVA